MHKCHRSHRNAILVVPEQSGMRPKWDASTMTARHQGLRISESCRATGCIPAAGTLRPMVKQAQATYWAATAKKRLNRMRLRRRDPAGYALADRIQERRLTFLGTAALLDLRRVVLELDKNAVPGVLMEAGCALGGSAIMLAAAKVPTRRLEVYDVFGQIPPPSDRDGDDVKARYAAIAGGEAKGFGGDQYYGYQPDLMQKVADAFAEFGLPCEANNITLVAGLFQDTIDPAGPVALAHVDGDWYESVKVCLDRIWPALSSGGVIVVDDYDAWSGCRSAVDEFLERTPEAILERHERVHLFRR